MVDYYNIHLRKTSSQTKLPVLNLERGMVVKIKYKKGKILKNYIVFVLQPKWPNTSEAKLHGLSFSVIPPDTAREISEIYNEVISSSNTLKRLDIAKIKINEASKRFYTAEIKRDKELLQGYRTFDLKKIQSVYAVNYDWGKFDKITPAAQRRIDEQKKLDDEQ